MADLERVISDDREAVGAFVAAARAVPSSTWSQPAAPGKWSPGQVTEHVALAYEVGRAVLQGTFAGRRLPRLLRPVVRKLFLEPVLRRGAFGKGGKAPGQFRPTASPAGQEALTARLQSASTAFEAEVAAAVRAGQATVDDPFFGHVPLAEYLWLQVIHTRHHRRQLPGVTG